MWTTRCCGGTVGAGATLHAHSIGARATLAAHPIGAPGPRSLHTPPAPDDHPATAPLQGPQWEP